MIRPKVGDMVRVVSVPDALRDVEDRETIALYERAQGQSFPVKGISGNLLELDIGEVISKSYKRTIYIESENVELVSQLNESDAGSRARAEEGNQ